MNLGTQTGSLVNHMYSRATIGQPKPIVGMGVTILAWSDRYAGTIQKVNEINNSKLWSYEIEVTRDNAKVIAGSSHDGSADYEYISNENGAKYLFRFNSKTQSWVEGFMSEETNRFKARKTGKGIRIGEREEYRDPSF